MTKECLSIILKESCGFSKGDSIYVSREMGWDSKLSATTLGIAMMILSKYYGKICSLQQICEFPKVTKKQAEIAIKELIENDYAEGVV